MIFVGCGMLAFALFILYDYGQMRPRYRVTKLFFAGGCAILLLCTVLLVWQKGQNIGVFIPLRILCALLAALHLALLIYTLFFALPFDDTYVKQNNFTHVYDEKMYALCRHPGILWFALFYLFFALAMDRVNLLAAALIWSVCNGIYALLQDRIYFPRLFDDYESYRTTTPFLLPNKRSVKRCIASFRRREN